MCGSIKVSLLRGDNAIMNVNLSAATRFDAEPELMMLVVRFLVSFFHMDFGKFESEGVKMV